MAVAVVWVGQRDRPVYRRRLCAEGAHVVVNDINEAGAKWPRR
jgi:hypothetical protein